MVIYAQKSAFPCQFLSHEQKPLRSTLSIFYCWTRGYWVIPQQTILLRHSFDELMVESNDGMIRFPIRPQVRSTGPLKMERRHNFRCGMACTKNMPMTTQYNSTPPLKHTSTHTKARARTWPLDSGEWAWKIRINLLLHILHNVWIITIIIAVVHA